ncbi:bifunctional folylpolyglutamate synthase/dihydrofolate synthase [Oceanobacillus kimchii]|uniref:tetrahydrofolate synthase n=1 Tax=Oceanobacillus kimchii TaxID=746691 RepID=A0ABQ5TL13_9BACI|nr:folylpolyglutamate synthase/dihydrofolate synthase family protein [Oceanobacillus kimchii]MCT1575767.1 bifunctional folylpolyglutamate synthase/dihydrofolate synthase [Oceanobacillus kimchii]MCT2135404.1 bifunctional folylpolyglutamate synthase/dihydrofolate synthase [Oceanobacillus kimchii]GLO66720.1 bifunctional folylpolyglutamate synthase/dihydrofolate synthase [Oceanobacillus kimchii]
MLFQQIEQYFNNRETIGVQPGLDRVNKLLKYVNYPDKNLPIIHIAGTNGKGSTSQFIQSALLANNYKVGSFTSPSFYGIRGFIQINQQPVSESVFSHAFQKMLPAIEMLDKEENSPSNFEILTVLSFVCFEDNVDIAVVEAGMGGMLDTTNVISPILTIITTVSYDHTAFLGDTLVEIAEQKAGIIKPLIPMITGVSGAAYDIIEKKTEEMYSPLFVLDKDFTYESITMNRFIFNISKQQFHINLDMSGKHQHYNASIALYGLHLLREQGWQLTEEKIIEGVEQAKLPGRLEKIHNNPSIIVDGAHNLEGIHALVDAVKRQYSKSDHHILFAAFKDKDVENMINCLKENLSNVNVTTFDHVRAPSLEELELLDTNQPQLLVYDWKKYIDTAFEHKNECYYITGSLHFISLVRQYVKELQRNMLNDS